jgi:RNA polymerase sigma factor (sigma-70 family)
MQGNSNNLWPGEDDTQAIAAMLNDQHPFYEHHWQQCYAFVIESVKRRASDFSKDDKDDISQNVMINIGRSLVTFKRKCKLTTWITKIVINCVINARRARKAQEMQRALPPQDPADNQHEDFASRIRSLTTTEEESLLREDLRAIKKLLEQLAKHTHKERAIKIFDMHLEGLSHEEIARKLDIPQANVGYAIRSLQEFLRKNRDSH